MFLPMFHSPLGACASFGAVEFPNKVRNAIDKALRKAIPRILPFGAKYDLHNHNGHETRIRDQDEFDTAIRIISEPNFTIEIDCPE